MDAKHTVPHFSWLQTLASSNILERNSTSNPYRYISTMIQHKLITDPLGATISMGIANRQMSTASFDLRPAGDIEILGIATATSLLAFFLCHLICVGLRALWHTSSAIEMPRKRSEAPRPVRKWFTTAPSQPHDSYGGRQESSRTPYVTSSARDTHPSQTQTIVA
ncbi:hypothetical protein F5Y03DRAFT_402627 [Xylaria venustula]|nr:hypothetical protein F5Y03DRAFT_402627 [Xylaria venustula]